MEKPIKESKPMLNYHKMIKYIEEKYNIKTRDYHETYSKSQEDWEEYLDFWHWLVDTTEISNNSSAYLNIEEWLEDVEIPNWVGEILKLIKIEFGEESDKDGGIEVWISW